MRMSSRKVGDCSRLHALQLGACHPKKAFIYKSSVVSKFSICMVHIIMTYAREEGVVDIVENFENQDVLNMTISHWLIILHLLGFLTTNT